MAALSDEDRRRILGPDCAPLPPAGTEWGMRMMAIFMVVIVVGVLVGDVVLSEQGGKASAGPIGSAKALGQR